MHQLRLFEMLVGPLRRPPRLAQPRDQQLQLALLNAEEIGITLSAEDQLDPEQSTSAIVVHHPQAKYFGMTAEPSLPRSP